ncbi:MAG: serine protease [Paracoccaceae bacterium]
MKLFGLVVCAMLAFVVLAPRVQAQDQAWLQIEAHPDLATAEDRARAYESLFPDVTGFATGRGWYLIALGPQSPPAAAGRLFELKQQGQIPPDAFISDGSNHGQRFWPNGALPDTPAVPDQTVIAPEVTPPTPLPELQPLPPPLADPEETPRQARAAEDALNRDDRRALQTALQWFGFYTSTIDGAFGPGTRNAMAAWQTANGFEPTGVLTTLQRAALVANYEADQAEFGFATLNEPEAGIEITLPLSLVQFDHYEPPFVHFNEKDGSGLRIILISQPGDQTSLSGLYDILQTLEVVPPEGERSRDERSFTINAANSTIQSYAYAETSKGKVKGFLAVWKPQDAARMERILPVLKASFRSSGDKSLDPGLVPMADETRRGLLSGLEVRKPKFSRSGFYVDDTGRVLTTAEAVAKCGRVTIDRETDATVTLTDTATGAALLTPTVPLSPPARAAFVSGLPRIGSEIVVAGYSYEDALPAPVLTFGALEDTKGLDGEGTLRRLTVAVLPGDAGGPVLDSAGNVIGLLQPAHSKARQLPPNVAFATGAEALTALLAGTGAIPRPPGNGTLTPDQLSKQAIGMTVLVSCWD